MRAVGIDHVVLRVSEVERSVAWYRDVLGLEPVRLEEWRRGEVPFVSMRVDDATIIDLTPGERTGENVDHLCVLVEDADLHAISTAGHLECEGPPRRLFGARGVGWGMYVRDPDGNRVELRHYGEEPGAPA
jgi:catechol 2,3-dioxygenase-like lactoylglutathione lyase family enzyme